MLDLDGDMTLPCAVCLRWPRPLCQPSSIESFHVPNPHVNMSLSCFVSPVFLPVHGLRVSHFSTQSGGGMWAHCAAHMNCHCWRLGVLSDQSEAHLSGWIALKMLFLAECLQAVSACLTAGDWWLKYFSSFCILFKKHSTKSVLTVTRKCINKKKTDLKLWSKAKLLVITHQILYLQAVTRHCNRHSNTTAVRWWQNCEPLYSFSFSYPSSSQTSLQTVWINFFLKVDEFFPITSFSPFLRSKNLVSPWRCYQWLITTIRIMQCLASSARNIKRAKPDKHQR